MERIRFELRSLVSRSFVLLIAGFLALMGWASPSLAQTMDDVFGSASVFWGGIDPNSPALIGAQWVAAADNPAVGKNGRRFVIDFSNGAVRDPVNRGSWIVDTNLDLSTQKSFRLYVYVSPQTTGATAIQGITLYAFGANFSERDYSFTVEPGLNVIDVNRDDFAGAFSGADSWSYIRQVRMSIWRKTDGTGNGIADVTVSAVQSTNPVQTLDAIFNGPTTWEGITPVSIGIIGAYQQTNDGTGTPGHQFVVDFANQSFAYPNEQRGSWFTATDLNLSRQKSIKLDIYVNEGLEFYNGMTLYFIGAGGSSKDQTFSIGPGHNVIEASLDRFGGAWGGQDGWHNIKKVQMSLWKRNPGRSSVNVRATQLTSSLAVDKLGNGTPFIPDNLAPGRRIVRNAAGELLESRMLFDAEFWLAQDVTTVLDRTQYSRFNVYMPSAWLGGGRNYRTLTPSLFSFDVPIVTAPAYRTKIQNDDPLAQLIAQAHSRRMEVHPSFTIANRYDGILPQFSEPGSPVIGPSGATAFDLHNPAYRDFIVKLIIDFVKNYDVDGINLDYIRTMGMSFSASAKAEYQNIYGSNLQSDYDNPSIDRQRFRDFHAGAVNDIVMRVRSGINALNKPRYIVISIAGSPKPKPSNGMPLDQEGRNEWIWVQNGWVDVVYDMDYGRNPSTTRLVETRDSMPAAPDSYRESWAKLLGNGDVINSQPGARSGQELVAQIDYFIRRHPGRGIGVYQYQWLGGGSQINANQADALRNGPFNEVAYPLWWVNKQGSYWVR